MFVISCVKLGLKFPVMQIFKKHAILIEVFSEMQCDIVDCTNYKYFRVVIVNKNPVPVAAQSKV